MGRGVVHVTPEFLAQALEAANRLSEQIVESPRALRFVGALPSGDLQRGRLWLMVESPEIPSVPMSHDPPTVEVVFKPDSER